MLSPLARALPAMTALQATIALGMFALSVLAPQLGLSVPQLAALNTLLFSVGALGAAYAGRLLERFGDWNVAALCAAAVAAGMGCLLVGGPLGPWLAALLFGIAFGPETPASASVLSRFTPAAKRPWLFSVRQTGNQIGAMAGSLLLPLLIVTNPQLPYLVVGAVGLAMAAWCGWLSRDPYLARGAVSGGVVSGSTRAALRTVLGSRPLRALSFAALCYTAVQMCLNTFLMSLAVRDWQLDVGTASLWVAGLQAAGLGGRLFWGWLAQRSTSAARLLGGLGLLIAASGAVVMAWPGARSGAGLGLAVAVLGFSASGWNGVLVAEVSRVAGPRDAGALTGAVLMFGYAGLALSPLAFAALSAAVSMSVAFIALFAAASIAGLVLLLDRR
ncbi:MAG: MFS transporter [Burkholderiaceae bacterium]